MPGNDHPDRQETHSKWRSIFTRIARQGGIYALGNIALKASGFLLAILYLNPEYFSVEAFGYFSLLFITANFGIVVVGLGIGPGLLKYMTDPEFQENRQALPFTALVATTGVAVLALGAFSAAARPIAAVILDSSARVDLIYLMILYVVFQVIGKIPLMLLRVQERAGWYVTISLVEMLVLLGAAYYLVIGQDMSLFGLMAAYTISAGVSTIVLVGGMLGNVTWRFDQGLVRKLAEFGVPLVMASLASWFLGAGDRYLLKWLSDTRTVGLYEWAARLAGVLNLLFVQSFNMAFSVVGLKTLGREQNGGKIHQQVFRHYVIWTGWATLGLSLFVYDVTRLLPADPFYLQASSLVFFLGIGFMAYGIYYIINNIVYATGRSRMISLNVMAAAVLNALLNILLIPVLGATGAALATVFSYLMLAAGAAYLVRQSDQLRFPWSVLAVVLGLISGLYLIGQSTINWTTLARLTVRLGILLAYPLLVVLAGLYSRSELRKARTWVYRQWQQYWASEAES